MEKESVLLITDVCKYLDGKQILFNVSLDIKEGEVFWFLGPNWAGKTTTMKCILWLINPESGSIEILWSDKLDNSIKAQIGFMPENTYLYKYLTWYEFLKFNAWFFNIPASEMDDKINELLDKVGLRDSGKKLLAKYSKWMLQRIWLAQAILNDPKIVFLDEPMSWLDPLWRKMVKDLILDLKKNWTTVFFNTHILSDVESICDRFAIINKWHLIAEDKIKNLKTPLEDLFIEKIKEHIWDEILEIK
ncbi:MAG: ABC transporter, ATPase subunit [uncultured bacterium (gcode 4)]|uniref:ABC transporter, ATPase subunit n=1 Tax=uncultured bacterium (gcode 4) TaxID=1234023 RepID=K2H1H7_9BACT|nr:MAG: ABC transporter, ATPase subunit [uncultured bacterium (gcode 4)]